MTVVQLHQSIKPYRKLATMFTETEIPTTSKPADLGPFPDLFPTAEGKAVSAKFPNNAEGQESVKTATRQARAAAAAIDLSARVKSEVVKEGKVESVLLTIWTVPKITRARKDTDAPAAAE